MLHSVLKDFICVQELLKLGHSALNILSRFIIFLSAFRNKILKLTEYDQKLTGLGLKMGLKNWP